VRTLKIEYDSKMNEINMTLTILGSLVSLLLLLNAHFTRKTLEKITTVEIQLAVLISKHDSTDERARKNEFEIELLKSKINKLETKVLSNQ